MDQQKMANQMIGYQKSLFESSFSAICALQDQTEKISKTFLDQMTWLPKENRQMLQDSLEMFKSARDTFKKSMDEGYARLDELFSAKHAS